MTAADTALALLCESRDGGAHLRGQRRDGDAAGARGGGDGDFRALRFDDADDGVARSGREGGRGWTRQCFLTYRPTPSIRRNTVSGQG